MCSIHKFEFFDNEEVCINCGICSGVHYDHTYEYLPTSVLFGHKLENLLVHPVTGEKLDSHIQKQVLTLYDNIVHTYDIRGFENKGAMLCTCLFYVCITNTDYITWQDIRNHSQLSLRRLNVQKRKFVEFYPQYSTVCMKPSDFMPYTFARHKIAWDHFEKLSHKCKLLDYDPKFINFNPAMVTGCLVLWSQDISINTLCRIQGFNYHLVNRIVGLLKDKFN